MLSYGQRALQGQTVNLPVNTSKVCSSLPKPFDNAGIILIVPPKTESSSVVTATPVPQTYFTIHSPYIIRALYWLKDLYRDIQIEELDSLDDSPVIQ